jgi:hypothetical protein
MPLTPTYGLPYPSGADTPDIPRDFKALAEAVARELGTASTRAVNAGLGLTGGGTIAADRTLNVGAGAGISVVADTVAVDTVWADARYVNTAGDSMGGALYLQVATPTIANQAAHKGYVDSRIWTGTQSAYDAIPSKDPTVLYVITAG